LSARSARCGAFLGEAAESQDCGGRRIANDVFFVGRGWEDVGEEDGIAALGDGLQGGGADDPGVAGDRFCDRQKQYSKSRFHAQNGEIVKVND